MLSKLDRSIAAAKFKLITAFKLSIPMINAKVDNNSPISPLSGLLLNVNSPSPVNLNVPVKPKFNKLFSNGLVNSSSFLFWKKAFLTFKSSSTLVSTIPRFIPPILTPKLTCVPLRSVAKSR